MGRDKAWVNFDGNPLIQLAVEKVRALGVEEVFISGRVDRDYSALKCPVLFDLEPGLGPLSGIERGLRECTSPRLLALAVDLPHMTTAFLRKLRARCDQLTGVVPRLNGRLEPLVAIYPKRCHAFAADALAGSRRAAQDFATICFRRHAVRNFSISNPDDRCFANWNYPADLTEGSRA